jgi:hypothetical protein
VCAYIVFTRVIVALVYFLHSSSSRAFRRFLLRISQPSILHLGMVTHSNCRSWQTVTSFVLQECGISGVLIRTLGLYYNAETFHFKFMNRIPNYRPNLNATTKTMPSKNSSHNFRNPIFWQENWPKTCENYASKTIYMCVCVYTHTHTHMHVFTVLVAVQKERMCKCKF